MRYSIMNGMQNHQQALIVVLSYVIGFITAFIMFGLVNDGKDIKEVSLNRLPEDMISDDEVTLEYLEDGLFLTTKGEQQIISAQTDAEMAEPGFHVKIITSSMSPNDKYVLYCAQMDTAAEACHYFVYSIDEHKTYMVKHRDDRALLADNDQVQELSWTDNSELKMLDFTANAESRWEFTLDGCGDGWGGACGL